MKYLDLTRTFNDSLPVYPGDPAPVIKRVTSVEDDGFTLREVTTGMHAGTHMDAPLHFIANGKTMDQISVEKFFGRGVLVDARGKSVIDETVLEGVHLAKGDIVLVLTGWSTRFDEEAYFTDHPDMTMEFAKRLVEAGVVMVGSDSASPDHDPFVTHKTLLSAEVLIIENLINLEQLVGVAQFEVMALPVKFETEAAPVRVVARY